MKLWLILATALLAYGQEFEVATIKPAAPLNAAAIQAGKLNIGQRITGNQVDIGYVSLRALTIMAYEVKPHQVTAPDWADEQRYDIHGLMPEGADPKQIPAMLRALLKERFKLEVAKTTKELDVFSLEVARDGHKMQPSPELPAAPAAEPPKPVAGERNLEVAGQQLRVNQQAVAGGGVNLNIAGGVTGTQKMSVTPDGRMHLEIERLNMPQFADTLTTFLDLPVVDHTNLTGSFQVALDMTMADLLRVSAKVMGASAMAGAQAALAGRGAQLDPGTDIIGAVQKLGLRLNKQKSPVDMIVVESANRTPSEN